MWVFSTLGFFSIVCARKGKGEYGQPPDPNRFNVRARSIAHLQNLHKAFPQLREFEIIETPSRDYAARILVPKVTMLPVLAALVESIDYGNFKSEVSAVNKTEASYSSALHDVWSVMNRFQGRVGNTDSRPWWERKRGKPDPRQQQFEDVEEEEVDVEEVVDEDEGRVEAVVVFHDAPALPPSVPRFGVKPGFSGPKEIQPSTRMDSTDVLIVRSWSANPGKEVSEPVAAVVDFKHYPRGRVAVRDLATAGLIERIARANLALDRTTLGKVRHFVGRIPVFSLEGVVPSCGEPVADPKKAAL